MTERISGDDIRYGPNGEFAQLIYATRDQTGSVEFHYGTVEELKKRGNDFFKAKDYENAKGSYTSALEELVPVKEASKSMEGDYNMHITSEAKLLCNRGFCYLKMQKYDRAIRDFTNCLKCCIFPRREKQPITHIAWNPKLVDIRMKALFRRSLALEALGNFPSALCDVLQSTYNVFTKETVPMNKTQKDKIRLLGGTKDHIPDDIDLRFLDAKNPVVVTGARWTKVKQRNRGGPEPWSQGSTCVHYDGKLYLLGGERRNKHNKIWSELMNLYPGRMPTEQERLQWMAENASRLERCMSFDQYIDGFWSFDLKTLNWKKLRSVIRGRCFHSAVVYNDAMYVLGGLSSKESPRLDKLWKYNFTSQTWSSVKCKGRLPKSRSEHSALVHQDSMYIFGGEINGDPCNELWEFNFSSSRWTKICGGKKPFDISLPEIRTRSAFWVDDDKLWIYGGIYERPDRDQEKDYSTFDCWTFDLNSRKWSEKLQFGNLPSPRVEFGFCKLRNSCFVFGGYNQSLGAKCSDTECASHSYFNDAFLYSSTHRTWRMIHPEDWKRPPLNAGSRCVQVGNDIYSLLGYLGGSGDAKLYSEIWKLSLLESNVSKSFKTCANCEKTSQEVRLIKCSGKCGGIVSYCGRKCQKAHWDIHKKICGRKKPNKKKKKEPKATLV